MGQVDDAGVGHENQQADEDRNPQHELDRDDTLFVTKKSEHAPHHVNPTFADSLRKGRLRHESEFTLKGHLEKCPDEPEPGQRTSPGLGILAFGRS